MFHERYKASRNLIKTKNVGFPVSRKHLPQAAPKTMSRPLPTAGVQTVRSPPSSGHHDRLRGDLPDHPYQATIFLFQ